ncbi:toc-1, partial [Pristionchus pacificus]
RMGWLSSSLSHPQGYRALVVSTIAAICTITAVGCYCLTHSLLIMSCSWLSLLAFCSLVSSLYSMSITYRPTPKFSYGLARVPVLAVFSTTVLAQLFSVFLTKESFEHILAPDHHGRGGHDSHDAHSDDHGSGPSYPYYLAAAASSLALLLSAYSLRNQPFQHVLTASTTSAVQEHAADLCEGICWLIPGLSRLLLPRINAMVLLAAISTPLILLDEHLRDEISWADPVCCLVLSLVIFSSMYPLSLYTGRILLQTAPPHLLNQLDRCLSESSHIEGVLEVRSAHFWQIDFSSMAGSVDVRVRRDADEQKILAAVTDKLVSLVPNLSIQVMKDAAWGGHDTQSWGGGQTEVRYSTNENHHGLSHEGGGHGHSHDGHGHSH